EDGIRDKLVTRVQTCALPILICRDPEAFVLARKLKWFGYDRDAHKDERGEWKGQRWSADIEAGEIGFKYNMNNITAAIGLAQMPDRKSVVQGKSVDTGWLRRT